MSDSEGRLRLLERRVEELSSQLGELQALLMLVGDVQRFSRLRQLLRADELDAADQETARLLQEELAGGSEELTPESLERCSAGVLLILDSLWQAATAGRQGFGVQQRIYRALGGSRDSLLAQNEQLFHRFTDAVGWPLLEGVGFALPDALTVPVSGAVDSEGMVLEGHLPLRCWSTDYGLKAANLLMARLIEVCSD